MSQNPSRRFAELTNSVSAEAVHKAKKTVLERNTAGPDYPVEFKALCG